MQMQLFQKCKGQVVEKFNSLNAKPYLYKHSKIVIDFIKLVLSSFYSLPFSNKDFMTLTLADKDARYLFRKHDKLLMFGNQTEWDKIFEVALKTKFMFIFKWIINFRIIFEISNNSALIWVTT